MIAEIELTDSERPLWLAISTGRQLKLKTQITENLMAAPGTAGPAGRALRGWPE